MDLNLNGRNALVTGSTRGLGLAAARLLVQEGARVAINGRSAESLAGAIASLQTDNRDNVIGIEGDVTRPETAGKLVQEAAAHFGGLDILITNSAGPPAGAFESFNDADWQQATEMSFLSHVRLIRAALPALRDSPAASVLAVTSYSVKHPIDNLILSNSIRLATVGLIKSLSFELGRDGIRFNAILPGWTETERVGEIMKSRAAQHGTQPEEEASKQAAAIPLRRMAQPEEFARAAVFLVSPAASYINGVMLQVDGGITRSVF